MYTKKKKKSEKKKHHKKQTSKQTAKQREKKGQKRQKMPAEEVNDPHIQSTAADSVLGGRNVVGFVFAAQLERLEKGQTRRFPPTAATPAARKPASRTDPGTKAKVKVKGKDKR